MQNVLSTSELLEKTANEHTRDHISLGEIKDALHERGFGILFIVFSLPLLIPLPLPTGIGTAMSVPIFFFAYQLIMSADSPWLPKWVLEKELGIETFRKIVSKSSKLLKFFEKFLKERFTTISNSRSWEIFIGIFIVLLNIPICLPFPMSNTIPAVSIIVISLGMLEKDGLMIIAGWVIGIIAWLICIAIGFALYYGASEVYRFLPSSMRDEVKHLKHEYIPEVDKDTPITDYN